MNIIITITSTISTYLPIRHLRLDMTVYVSPWNLESSGISQVALSPSVLCNGANQDVFCLTTYIYIYIHTHIHAHVDVVYIYI